MGRGSCGRLCSVGVCCGSLRRAGKRRTVRQARQRPSGEPCSCMGQGRCADAALEAWAVASGHNLPRVAVETPLGVCLCTTLDDRPCHRPQGRSLPSCLRQRDEPQREVECVPDCRRDTSRSPPISMRVAPVARGRRLCGPKAGEHDSWGRRLLCVAVVSFLFSTSVAPPLGQRASGAGCSVL